MVTSVSFIHGDISHLFTYYLSSMILLSYKISVVKCLEIELNRDLLFVSVMFIRKVGNVGSGHTVSQKMWSHAFYHQLIS